MHLPWLCPHSHPHTAAPYLHATCRAERAAAAPARLAPAAPNSAGAVTNPNRPSGGYPPSPSLERPGTSLEHPQVLHLCSTRLRLSPETAPPPVWARAASLCAGPRRVSRSSWVLGLP